MRDDADDAFCNLPGPVRVTGGAGKGQGPLLPLVIDEVIDKGGGAGIPFVAIGRGGGGGP